MKRHIVLLLAVLACAMLVATGCRKGAPVLDFESQPMPQTSAKLTDAKIKDAMIRAGTSQGWQVVPEKQARTLRATLHNRTHVAVATITYTLKEFTIRYNDSTNLEYENGVIHPNYNRWVKNLHKAINSELARIQ